MVNILPSEMKDLGINLDIARSYGEVITKICRKKYDLILLTNLGIPVFEIPETLRTIRVIYKLIPIVILVSESVSYVLKNLPKNLVNEIFTIPFDFDYVFNTIKHIIYKRDYKAEDR